MRYFINLFFLFIKSLMADLIYVTLMFCVFMVMLSMFYYIIVLFDYGYKFIERLERRIINVFYIGNQSLLLDSS